MSRIVKGVGKVFKKVVKTVIKIAPYALAAAAVVFTGGAALGLGFAAGGFSAAVGGVVTSLGIGGAVGGALTGAITGAGMGAAVGGILGGKKGLKKGFLTGGLTGGVLGAVSPASVGIVKNAAGQWTTKQGIINAGKAAASGGGTGANPVTLKGSIEGGAGMPGSGAGQAGYRVGDVTSTSIPASSSPAIPPGGTAASGGLNAGGALSNPNSGFSQMVNNLGSTATAPAAAPAVGAYAPPPTFTPPVSAPSAAATGAQAAAKTGGLFGQGGFFQQNPALAGNLLTSVGGALTGGSESEDAIDVLRARTEEEQRMAQYGYGGVYTGKPNAFGNPQPYAPPPPRWYIDPQTSRVVEIPA